MRSAATVGAFVSHSPAVHCSTAVHGLPSLASEYEPSGSHAAHWRFATALPATDMPSPIAHVRQMVHAPLPAVALNCPPAHSTHVRSAAAVAAVASA
jgi:hypothetical protein